MNEYEEPPATLYFLSIIAQEEFAKGFLLYLVSIDVVPWNQLILRATRDHKCKHLLGMVLDHLNPDDEIWNERFKHFANNGIHLDLPQKIFDAIDFFRNEKIRRFESSKWWWDEEPDWDGEVLAMGSGRLDRGKQDSLYVRLGKDGSIASTPWGVTKEQASKEYERGKRFREFMEDICEAKEPVSIDYERIKTLFKDLFSR